MPQVAVGQIDLLVPLRGVAVPVQQRLAVAFPLRGGNTVFGVLELYRASVGELSDEFAAVAQLTADAAAISLLEAFAPGLGATSMTREGYVGRDLTVLATLAVVAGYVVFTQTALPGFTGPYQAEKHAAPGLGRAALVWCAVAKTLKWAWLVFAIFIVLGCLLSLHDNGTPWHV